MLRLLHEPQPPGLAALPGRPVDGPSPHEEASNVAPLPARLDSMPVIVLADEGDGFGAGHAVQDGQAGKRCSGTPAPSGTAELDPLSLGSSPRLGQGGHHLVSISGQAEVRPPQPPRLPRDGRRRLAEQVNGKGGVRSVLRGVP